MKLLTTISLTLLLSFTLQNLNAQAPPATENNITIPAGWEISDNWLYDYRENLCPNASLTWINGMISDGAQMLTNSLEKGIILIEVTENEDQLSEKELAEESSLDGHDMDLVATKAAKDTGFGVSKEWFGTIGGQRVIVQKICMLSSDATEVTSILSIVPASTFGKDNFPALEAGYYLATQITLESTGLFSHHK